MDYKKKYKEALERMKSWARGEHPECFSEAQKAAEFIFPELKESEDERIRKEIIELVWQPTWKTEKDFQRRKELVAWLEKQKSVEEIVERYKNSWYNEGKIQGQIEGLSDDEKYQQGWHDALEKAENFLEMLGCGFTITDNITHTNYGKEQLIEDFKKYMKGE